MPNISLKTTLRIVVLVLFLGLSFYCSHLRDQIRIKDANLDAIQDSYNEKVSALTECSANTDALKAREDQISAHAQAALAEAKKSAVEDYKASQGILFRKPTQPVITSNNQSQYGGSDKDVQLKDYLATQELMNELIDSRSKK